ncbi:MAG: SAM-dependent methyltransferase [Gammaproteobacteria bacterium]|jgi:SAM-dependent methyltransferase
MNPSNLLEHVIAPAPRYILRLSLLEGIFAKHVPKNDYSLIEFGPGLGDISHYLAQDPSCRELTLVDFSQTTLNMLRERFRDSKITRFSSDDISEVPSGKTFDLVLAFEVLEHIDDDIGSLHRIFDLTAAGGQFIMSVPAYQKKWQKIDAYSGHFRRYERAELNQKLKDSGFSSIEIVDYGFPLTALMYPFRQAFYRPNTSSSLKERSKKSGITRPFFASIPLWLLRPVYAPFIFLQRMFINRDLGDGFIAIAKKP